MKALDTNPIDNFNEEEVARLNCLRTYEIMDSEIEGELEELTHLAALICNSPISLITLVDESRQWFKSKYGLDLKETERCFSFCHHTIKSNTVLEVEDALNDKRFAENPLVIGDPNIRFYCGAPLISPDGFRLGSLCVIDNKPKTLSSYQTDALKVLSKQVVAHFELKKQKKLLEKEKMVLERKVEERTSELGVINQELNTFIYKASHDIRGPLATIIGLSHLGVTKANDKEAEFFFQNITETSYRLDQTLRNLLKVMQLKDSPLNLDSIYWDDVKEDILAITDKFNNSDITFTIECPERKSFVTDKDLLVTIVNNLIDNSVKFSMNQKGAYVKVRINEENEGIKLIVEDNSEGIEEDIRDKVFGMFYRANGRSKGSGLGLYIVKSAVDKLSGQIDFESRLYKGTTFNIFLPKL